MDFSTALCDAQGQHARAGADHADPARQLLRRDALPDRTLRDDVRPGDVFLGNDPYAAAGQHLPDIYVIRPIFDGGPARRVGDHDRASCRRRRHRRPAERARRRARSTRRGCACRSSSSFDQGKRNDTLWDVIALNTRTPDMVMGDLNAQLAAGAGRRARAARRMLASATAPTTVLRYAEHLHDYTERLARAELREIPDGTYRFTDHIDGLGEIPEPIVAPGRRSAIRRRSDVDWTGTSPQVKGGINPSFPFTKACAYTAFRSVMKAEMPNCHGFTRAIEVTAPLGSLVKPVLSGALAVRAASPAIA
jgi:N-methylhydantoinase B